MLLKSNVIRILLSFCLVFSLAAAALADTIRLKDGSVIKGRIIGFRDGQFLVQLGEGARARQMTFFADEIEAIEFDAGSTTAANSASRTNTSSPGSILPRPVNSSTPNPQSTASTDPNRIVVGQSGDPNGRTTSPQTASPNTNPPPAANNSNQQQQPTSSPALNRPTANPTTSSAPGSNPPPTPANTSASNRPAPPTTNTSRPQPIRLSLKVLADNTANGWTNAGWVVKKGQKIRISGSGRISLGGGNYSTPAGLSSLADKDKLIQREPTGGLIAVISDDNNDFIFIGSSREFTATRDGALFLGVNEGNLNDNSGSFEVVVEIDPGS